MKTLAGSIPLVESQQSYSLEFDPPFTRIPSFFKATVAMPSSSGEIFKAAAVAPSASSATITLDAVPSAASVGGFINWLATGS